MATTIKVQLYIDGLYMGVANLDEITTPIRKISIEAIGNTNNNVNLYEVSANHNIYGNWGISLLLGEEVDRNITEARGLIPKLGNTSDGIGAGQVVVIGSISLGDSTTKILGPKYKGDY